MPAHKKYAKKSSTVSNSQLLKKLNSLSLVKGSKFKGRGNYTKKSYQTPYQKWKEYSGGQSAISAVGEQLGGMASTWLGMGNYTVSENTLISPSSVPYMHSTNSNIRIRHKEFIRDVSASNAFSLETLSVNPGLSSTFPYLSGIARNFESYRIHGMVFYFKSNSADALNSTNTALGTIIMASDYNVLDQSFQNKMGMEATTFSNSTRPSQDMFHPIECAPNQSSSLQRYIRGGAVTSGDLRLYDWCNTQIASQGVQANSVVGELHVSYDIELINPQLTVPRGLNIPCEMIAVTASTVTNLVPLGTGGVNITNTMGVGFNNNVIVLPANLYGKFILNLVWIGGSQTTTLSSIIPLNVTELNLFNNKTAALQTSISGGAESELFIRYCFEITDPTQAGTIQINGLVLPTPVVSLDINIMKINGNAA